MKNNAKKYISILYSTPFGVLLIIFALFPFVLNLAMSFTNYGLMRQDWNFVGIKNYVDILSDQTTWKAIRLTIVFIIGCVGLTMLLGMFYAIIMTFKIKGISIIKALILMPWIIPESVTAYVWKWLFSADTGLIYYILLRLGVISEGTSFFFNGYLAMLMVILANVWRTAPFVAIMNYAKLTAVPDSQIEAAKIDGASSLQAFAYIKIPWIMPIVERCIMLLFVWSFNSFSIIYILTNGGPAGDTTTLPYLIRQAGFVNFNFSRAATLSAVSLLIILFVFGVVRIVFMLAKKITKRR